MNLYTKVQSVSIKSISVIQIYKNNFPCAIALTEKKS